MKTPAQKTRTARTKATALPKLRSKDTTTMAAAASVSPDKPLTDKQRAFVKAWAEGDPIPNAMARAGYSTTQVSLGYRMQKMPNILALYHAEKAKYEEAGQMSRKKVMDMLVEAYDMAKLTSEPSSMVAAAREVGRMCGYYEPTKAKLEITVNGQIAVDRMNRLSDEELMKIIMGGSASTPQGGLFPALGGPDDTEDDQ